MKTFTKMFDAVMLTAGIVAGVVFVAGSLALVLHVAMFINR